VIGTRLPGFPTECTGFHRPGCLYLTPSKC
jgi:hypothetical protein